MDSKSIFRKNEKIVYREEDDGAFLFDPDSGDLRYMNQSGKETFAMVKGGRDIRQIVDSLSGLYPEVEPPQIQSDVENFLTDLAENHFILPLNHQ